MNNINILGRKLVDHKLFFPISLLLSFLVYLPLFNTLPFGDDFVYIFNNEFVTGAPHPFVFWSYGEDTFKSWPLSFSFLWIFYKLFGQNFFVYRVINLIIHILNSYLVHKISSKKFPKYSKYIYIFFLLHPMAVENIYWIFQFKTLLSLTFFLTSFYYLILFNDEKKKSHYLFSVILFTLSLLSKTIAILAPISMIIFLTNFKKLHRSLLLIPFFILSTISGVESIKGVSTTKSEEKQIVNFQQDYFKKKEDYLEKNKVSIKTPQQVKPKTVIVKKDNFDKHKKTIKAYWNSISNYEPLLLKTAIMLSSVTFYIKTSLGLTINQIVYEDLNFTKFSEYILMFVGLVIICLGIFLPRELTGFFVLTTLLYLPISGLFYVPYMQYSYVADHWFYPALSFFIIILIHFIMTKFNNIHGSILASLGLLLLIQTFSYTSRLSDSRNYFHAELKRHNYSSQILYEYLVEIEKKYKNNEQALNLSMQLYKLSKSKKDIILDSILSLSSQLKKWDIFAKYSFKKAIIYFKNGSVNGAIDILNTIPDNLRAGEFYFLLNLFTHAQRRVSPRDIELLKNYLIK